MLSSLIEENEMKKKMTRGGIVLRLGIMTGSGEIEAIHDRRSIQIDLT